MKAAIFIIILFLTPFLSGFSQEVKYSDLATLVKSETKFESYLSKDGVLYKIGDKIKIGYPSLTSASQTFTYITDSDILNGITKLPASHSGNETEIKKILLSGSKRTGYYIIFWTKGFWGPSTLVIEIEKALATGEIKSSVMSSDEALSELKKAKDKLDLELITQEKYDSIKAELSKYIK